MDYGRLIHFNRLKNSTCFTWSYEIFGCCWCKDNGSILAEKSYIKLLGLFCSSKFIWGSYIVFNAKTVSNKIGILPRSIKFLPSEVLFFLFRSTIRKVSLRVTTPFCFFPFSCQVLFFKRSNSPSHKNFLVPPLQTYFFNDTFLLLFNLKCRVMKLKKH